MDSLVGVNCFQGFTAELEVCYKNNSNKINKLGLWGNLQGKLGDLQGQPRESNG